MRIVLIRKMNYYISQDICLQSWGINFENQKKFRRVFWKFLKKFWDMSHSLWGWKIHPWFLRHFNDPFQMRHRIRGPHFRTTVSRAPFWDTRIEWLISRFRMWGPHFETQRSSAKFWDTECEGPSWRHLDRVLDFKTPNPRAPFQDMQIECSISRHQMRGPQQQDTKPFWSDGELNPSHLHDSPQSYHYTTDNCLLFLMNTFDLLKVKPLS